jgi:uncharacterized protein
MNEERVIFESGSLKLEGLLAKPDGRPGPVRAGVVCHPHPLYGGSMYNNVVDAALQAIWELGWASLRFNFRGVGESEGKHSGGAGEAMDAAAAVKFATSQAGMRPDGAVLVGYSFGAVAAMTAAPEIKDLGALVLVALPIRMADAAALNKFGGPIVLAAGDNDSYCPADSLEAIHKELGARSQLKIIEGADHFFGGYEQELAEGLAAMLKSV